MKKANEKNAVTPTVPCIKMNTSLCSISQVQSSISETEALEAEISYSTMTEVASNRSSGVSKRRSPRLSMSVHTKETNVSVTVQESRKYHPYQLNKQTSKEDLEKMDRQLSFTSAVESLAIFSPPAEHNFRDPFATFDEPSQCKHRGKETEKTLENDESAGDAAGAIKDYLADLLPSPVGKTPVDEDIMLPVIIDQEESSVDSKAQGTVSHVNSAAASWGGSLGGLVQITTDQVLSFWRLRATDLTIAYIFADESSGSTNYVVYKKEGESLKFVSQSKLSKYPEPLSVDISNCADDPRVFFFEASTQATGSGFLIPSSSWSDKSLSVMYDTSSQTAKLTSHDATVADAWQIVQQ